MDANCRMGSGVTQQYTSTQKTVVFDLEHTSTETTVYLVQTKNGVSWMQIVEWAVE